MIDLSNEQYRMLCKIKKNGSIQKSSLSEKEFSICQYLLEQNCVVSEAIPCVSGIGIKVSFIKSLPAEIRLNQTGEAQRYAFRAKFYKWWIPVIISIFAAIGAYRSELAALLQGLVKLLI